MKTVLTVLGLRPSRIGGMELFARELSEQLAREGWRSVLCFDSPPAEAVARFLELPNVTLETLPHPERFALRPHLGLLRLLCRHRPEILHLHFTGLVSFHPWLAWLSGTRRVFFTDHHSQPDVPVRKSAPKRVACRILNLPLSRVLCVCRHNAACLQTMDAIPPQRISVLYNGVDPCRPAADGEDFRQRFGIPRDRNIVMQVGSLSADKGVPDLLEAARLVTARRPGTHFVLVGDGPLRDRSSEHVTFTGPVTDPVAEGAYDAADVVCLLSRWQEAFSFAVLEAMSRGCPMVASRIGGIPEAVEDGVTGFLVPPSDVNAIASRLLGLLDDAGLRRRMGENARRAVETRFTVQHQVARLLSLYGIAPDRVVCRNASCGAC